MKQNTCFFTGHRILSEDERVYIRKRILTEIEQLADRGIKYFCSAGAIGFDRICELAVLDIKEKRPNIQLYLALPCKTQDLKWTDYERKSYEYVKARADKLIYTSEDYYKGCMLDCNRFLADRSGFCLCYQTKPSGGTDYAVRYAKDRGLTIINLARPVHSGREG